MDDGKIYQDKHANFSDDPGCGWLDAGGRPSISLLPGLDIPLSAMFE